MRNDRTIPNTKPDIIIRDNEKETCMLIDIAISGERIVIKKVAEKLLKYKNLILEIQPMRNVNAEVLLVIIGATGTIPKSLRKYLSHIPAKYEIKKLENAAILYTAHILRKVRMYNHKTYFTCEITLHVAQTVSTVQLQYYIP